MTQSNQRHSATSKFRHRRTGATVLECAFVLPIVLLILFALLDLGIAAARYNALADASRRIAREAIIHGSLAPAETGTWGPAEYVGTAADNSQIVDSVQNVLPTMVLSQVRVRVSWLDEDNSPGDRVEVALSYEHEPLIPALFVWGRLDLQSATTMHIVN
jgi:Flp pilus assembly protein TadG